MQQATLKLRKLLFAAVIGNATARVVAAAVSPAATPSVAAVAAVTTPAGAATANVPPVARQFASTAADAAAV